MSHFSEWKDTFSKLLGEREGSLGIAIGENGFSPSEQLGKLCEQSTFALDYLTHLVPHASVCLPPFRIFNLEEIEENLIGLCYSLEFQDLAFLPIGEFDNDKIVCIDGHFSGFVVFQLGMGTIQPIRRFMLFRCSQFSDFLAYVAWKSRD